jgi:hypothetical protein
MHSMLLASYCAPCLCYPCLSGSVSEHLYDRAAIGQASAVTSKTCFLWDIEIQPADLFDGVSTLIKLHADEQRSMHRF